MKSYDWIAAYANRTPGKLAQIDWPSQRRFSYAEMHERVAAVAGHLRQELGVLQGDRVAILAGNSSDTLELQFACARLGAIFVPLNTRLAPPELEYMLNDLGAGLLYCADEFIQTGAYLKDACGLDYLLSFSGNGGDCDYERGIAAANPVYEIVEVNYDDDWAILYTSGTTGRPKGARLTHSMAFFNSINLTTLSRITPDSVNLCLLPMFHTSGLNVYANPVFHAGGTNVIMGEFDPALMLKLIGNKDLAITHFIAVPAIYQFMASLPVFDNTDFSSVVVASVGGAPAPESLLQRYVDAGLPLSQGYGMTETGPTVIAMDREDSLRKIGSCGKPVLHVEMKLMRKDGSLARIGETGEIWVKGPSITPGYWQQADVNETDFSDGWLHTGDAAYCDEEGYYYIVDRWKDMYISGGENVYPAEVENIISHFPQVLECAVIGIADEKWGETGCAFIALNTGQTLTEEDLLQHCGTHLAKYKIPTVVHFLDELPHNATGKVVKAELSALHDQN